MSRTDIDPATLAKALRQMAGDGSIEWVMQPIQASVLLDVADALDENEQLRDAAERDADVMESLNLSLEDAQTENARLREELEAVGTAAYLYGRTDLADKNAKLRERVAELEELLPENGMWYRAETVEAYVAENAKLREFSARLYKHICIAEGYMRGSGYDSFDYYDKMARELGIEVDDERPNL